MGRQKGDLEAGSTLLYRGMQESPELRWDFIRKVYVIVTFQLLATIAFATPVAAIPSIASFFKESWVGLGLYIVVLVFGLFVMVPLYYNKHRHPLNFVLLGIFTLCLGFCIGVVSAFTNGKIVVEAALATTAVVIGLTVYTFWAARRGQDFGFLGPFLFSTLVVVTMFSVFQFFHPLGKVSDVIFSGVSALLFCGYIIYDTDNLIKRNSYDDYIWASVDLYLDIINLFLSILRILQETAAADS